MIVVPLLATSFLHTLDNALDNRGPCLQNVCRYGQPVVLTRGNMWQSEKVASELKDSCHAMTQSAWIIAFIEESQGIILINYAHLTNNF